MLPTGVCAAHLDQSPRIHCCPVHWIQISPWIGIPLIHINKSMKDKEQWLYRVAALTACASGSIRNALIGAGVFLAIHPPRNSTVPCEYWEIYVYWATLSTCPPPGCSLPRSTPRRPARSGSGSPRCGACTPSRTAVCRTWRLEHTRLAPSSQPLQSPSGASWNSSEDPGGNCCISVRLFHLWNLS